MPKKKGDTKAVKIAAVLVIALVLGGVVYFLMQNSAGAAAKVGDCIQVTKVSPAEIANVDCKSADAMYKVGISKDDLKAGCPSPAYIAYTETGGSTDVLLCLVLVAEKDQCFKADGQVFVKVDCAKGAEFKVVKVVDKSDDPTKCGAKGGLPPFTYPEPKLTICRAPIAATPS